MLSKIKKLSFSQFNAERKNMIWLLLEKGINLSFVLVVNIILARYLGPEKFGIINYLLAMVSIVVAIAPMGVNALVVKEILSSAPDKITDIIYNSLLIRGGGAIVVSIIFALLISLDIFSGVENYWLYLVLLSTVSSVFYLFDFYFQSQLKAKYSVLTRVSVVFIFSIFKLALIYYQAPFEYLLIIVVVEPAFLSIMYTLVFSKVFKGYRKPSLDTTYISSVFNRSKWLVFSSISSVICLKIDQLMLGEMSSMSELGNYAVAVRFSEVWYFVPAIIMTSYFPKLISLKNKSTEKYEGYLQALCNKLFVISLGITIFMVLVSEVLITILYGDIYIGAAEILVVHIFGSIFIFMRALFSKWIVNEGVYKFSLLTNALAAVVNVILNIFLIPIFGGVGAAWATVLSYVLSSYLILAAFKETRGFFYIMTRSISFSFFIKGLKSKVKEIV